MASIKIPEPGIVLHSKPEERYSWCYDCSLGPLDCPLQTWIDDGNPGEHYGHSAPGPDCPGPGTYHLVSEEELVKLENPFTVDELRHAIMRLGRPVYPEGISFVEKLKKFMLKVMERKEHE